MCSICGHKAYSTRHLLWWQFKWLKQREFKKFFLTWYHIVNRKAYWNFLEREGRHPWQIFLKQIEEYNRYFR